MLLSFGSIDFLCNILTGDSGLSCYKGKEFILTILKKRINNLEDFTIFYNTGNYPNEKDALKKYIKENLKKIRGTSFFTDIVQDIFNNNNLFIDNTTTPIYIFSKEEAVSAFNDKMAMKNEDGHITDPYFIKTINKKYIIIGYEDVLVDYRFLDTNDYLDNYHLINETSQKCLIRLQKEDYLGTITLARTFIEQITREILIKTGGTCRDRDDLPNLVNNCMKILKLDIDTIPQPVRTLYGKITSGIANITQGLSTMRNTMSDAHACFYKPEKKDAILAINTSRTLCALLLEKYRDLKNE